jgi:hypothetical protein
VGLDSPLRQLHIMAIILQRPTIDKAAQHLCLPPTVINAHLDKEAAAVVFAVVEVDATLIIPALGWVGAMTDDPEQLHDGREFAEGVEVHATLTG